MNRRGARLGRALTPLLLVVLICVQATVAQPSSVFDRANKLYEEGKYREAAAVYQTLLREGGVSPSLFFNLGNALFKSGQIGRAIISYRLAEQLAPRDPDIRANLQFARDTIVGGVSGRASALWKILNVVTVNELTILFTCSAWVWFGLLSVKELWPEFRRSVGVFPRIAAISCVLFALWLGAVLNARFRDVPSVVIAAEAVARYGPLDESQSAFTLRDGAELTDLDRKDKWLQVKDASGRIGWVRSEQMAGVLPESVLGGS